MATIKLQGDGIEPNQIIEVEVGSALHQKLINMGFVEVK